MQNQRKHCKRHKWCKLRVRPNRAYKSPSRGHYVSRRRLESLTVSLGPRGASSCSSLLQSCTLHCSGFRPLGPFVTLRRGIYLCCPSSVKTEDTFISQVLYVVLPNTVGVLHQVRYLTCTYCTYRSTLYSYSFGPAWAAIRSVPKMHIICPGLSGKYSPGSRRF